MYDNEYFVVDLGNCTTTGEIINNLSLALETLNHTGKSIVLKLNDNYLNQSQLLSIQSLITSYGCSLDTIETTNPETIAIVENMNIFVQKPIEKRVADKYDTQEEINSFQPFSMPKAEEKKDIIALKDVNNLHFEADLDALKRQQESIDISSDLKEAGINPKEDFHTIDYQVSSQYTRPQEVLNEADNFSKSDTAVFVQQNMSKAATMELEKEFENAEKNSIGVYKKAYPVISDSKSTTYVNQTLRSGQILESEGNVVIIGDCHPGSEIRAIGDITVWGVLSGIAHAGMSGNTNAKIRALKMNAVQLRIGSCYSRRPDGTNIPYILRSSIFTPEEARVVDGEIMLFKINQN